MTGILKVDSIQSSGGTAAMTIDSGGIISKSVIPYAQVSFNGSGYVSKSAGIIPFNNAVVNDGNHYDTTTYKFTCPVAGLYLMQFGTLADSGTSQIDVDFYNNNVRVFRGWEDNRAGHFSFVTKVTTAGHKLHFQLVNTISLFAATGTQMYTFGSYTLLG